MKHDVINMLERIPEVDYHAASYRGEYMSAHLLADFRRCPQVYHQKIAGIIKERPRSAYAFGTAAHKLILEGSVAFDEVYTVSNGPINPKTGAPYGRATKAYADWEAEQSGPVVTTEEMAQLEALRSSVMAHPIASRLLASGVAEGVAREFINGVPCQSRIDFFSPNFGIIDLKTCACLDDFEWDARRFHYIANGAFYRAVVATLMGVTFPVYLVAVEKEAPYRTGVWKIPDADLNEEECQIRAALTRFKCSRATEEWPTGFEELRYLTRN